MPQNLLMSRSYRIAVVATLVALLPWLVWATILALKSNSNDPRQWLPAGFPETSSYDWYQSYFGNDEVTIVSWDNCKIRDDQVDQLAQALIDESGEDYFEKAITGREIVRRMIVPPLKVPAQEAIKRLQGFLVGEDKSTTCVIATVSPRGAANRADAIDYLKRIAEEKCGLDPEALRLGGPTVDAATIDVESQRMLLELAGISAVVAMVITYWQLRNLTLTAILLFVAVYCTAVAMSILYVTGGNMNLVMTMLPPLVFVLTISASVHLVNYYRDAYFDGRPEDAPVKALRHGWKPCGLAAATTGLGLLSLGVSEIVPVKMFGIYSAAGILVSLCVILIALPIGLQLLLPRPQPASSASNRSSSSRRSPRKSRTSTNRRTKSHQAPQTHRIDQLYEFIKRHYRAIGIGFLCLMAICGGGLLQLRSTVKLQYRFGENSKIINDYRWLESHLGPLVPMELVVRFDKSETTTLQEEFQQVSLIQRELEDIPEVGAALSGVDFTPPLAGGSSVRSVIERVMWKRQSAEIEAQMTRNGFVARNEADERLWRISLRASALGEVDYGKFVATLRNRVQPLLQDTAGVDVTYTGIIPLIYKAQRELLNDLTSSFLMAFCLIALVISLVLRSLRGGLTAMLPNVFPVIIIFGLMGWLGFYVEIGSMMTTSAAMGIAVDDTIHLLIWHRRSLASHSREEAVRQAMRRCAGAMLNTTLICSCALLVFSFSSFMPIVRFAWLMAALLVTAIIGDLIFLPAILVSPLGKVFGKSSQPEPAKPSSRQQRQAS